jgi:hypothetical protein
MGIHKICGSNPTHAASGISASVAAARPQVRYVLRVARRCVQCGHNFSGPLKEYAWPDAFDRFELRPQRPQTQLGAADL